MSYEAPSKLDGERGILSELRKVAEEFKALAGGGRSNVRALRPGTITAQPGEITRAQANQVVLLPAAKAAQGAGATVLVESQPVTIKTSDRSSINGVASGAVVVTTLGTVECRSTGLGWWTGAAGGPGGAGAPVDAEYLVGAASAGLTNERVATDSTEIDVDLATPGVASWALRVASVVFAKLQNLAGLSILGRASNSAGVMAAITATAGGQYARSNAAGTALEFGDPASTSVVNTSGQLQRAALTGAIAAAQNGNATLFAGIRDNGSAENDRTNLNHVSTTSIIAVVTDDAGNDELEITHERAALTGFATASQNSNATSSAEPIVTYSASANMSAERVTTSSTSVTVSTSVASQIEFQRAALTGDVTAPANSNATTIANDAVTNAKLANMSAGTQKGRQIDSGAAGDPVDLTGAEQGENIRFATSQITAATGTQNNFVLNDDVSELSCTGASVTFTGFTRNTVAAAGKPFFLRVGSGCTVTLAHNTTSTANRQIACPNEVDFVMPQRSCVWLIESDDKWRVLSLPSRGALRDELLDESVVVLRDTFPTTHGTGAFTSGYSTLGWVNNGSLSISGPVNGVAQHPGIVRLSTAAGVSSGAFLLPTSVGVTGGPFVLADVYGFQWIARIQQTANRSVVFGLGDNASSTTLGSNSLYFRTDSATGSGVFHVHGRAAGASTEDDTSSVTPGAGDWFVLTVVKEDGTGDWLWDINGTSSGSIPAADVPTTTAMTPSIFVNDTDAAVQLQVDVDEFTIVLQPSGTRHS